MKTMTPALEQQLEAIGFEQDEITVFEMIRQFNAAHLLGSVKEVLRQYFFRRMTEEAGAIWDAKALDETQIFELVEQRRQDTRSHARRD